MWEGGIQKHRWTLGGGEENGKERRREEDRKSGLVQSDGSRGQAGSDRDPPGKAFIVSKWRD